MFFPNIPGKWFSIAIFILPIGCFSQVVEGRIFTAVDSSALQGVSIYFDGTSIGTTTNTTGEFFIQNQKDINTPLVISFLGYETVIFSKLSKENNIIPPIYLKEKPEELSEVIIAPDTWSREKKLHIFRREFLGNSLEAQKVRIKNEDVLNLRYNPTTNVLTAEAKEPLQIINRFLGYEIKYDLRLFEIEFITSESPFGGSRMVMYEGSSFFKEQKSRQKFVRNRRISYSGSPLHFIRSLAAQKLTENDFKIFFKGFQVEPYNYFKIQTTANGIEVELLTEKLSILYKDIEQSGVQMTGKVIIDSFGNHSPPLNVIFSGEMSGSRITHLLPLEYQPEKS